MAQIGDNLAKYTETRTSGLTITDCVVYQGDAGTVQTQTGAAARHIGGTVADQNRRRFFLLDVTNDKGYINNLSLRMNVEVAAGAARNMVFLPVVQQIGLTSDDDMSWDGIDDSGAIGWTDVAVATTGAGSDPGHNTDTNVRAVFAMPTSTGLITFTDEVGTGLTNPSSGSLDDVINRSIHLAILNGFNKAVVLLCSEDEANASLVQVSFTIAEAANTTNRPQVTSFELNPTPYDGWLMECEELAALPQTTKLDVGVQFGLASFAGTEEVAVRHRPDSNSAWTTETAHAVTEDPGVPFFWQITPSLASNGTFQWQMLWTIAAVEFPGEIRTSTLLSAIDPLLLIEGDTHWQEAIQGHEAYSTETLQAQAHTYGHMENEVDAQGRPPVVTLQLGDGDCYSRSNVNDLFPILTDGSGLGDSPNSKAATDQDDCDESTRAWNKNTKYPLYVPRLLILGNHESFWKYGYSANNGAVTDVAQWALNALIKYRRIPPSADYGEYLGDGHKAEYSIGIGSALLICLNAGKETTTDDAQTSELSNSPSNNTYWTLGATSISTTQSKITDRTQRFVITAIHHTLGGFDAVGFIPRRYSRYSHTHWHAVNWDSEVGDTLSEEAGNESLVLAGHDHNFDTWMNKRVRYVGMFMPGQHEIDEGDSGPYNQGALFSGNIHSEGARRDNAGYGRLTITASAMTLQIITCRTHTSPVDYFDQGNLAGIPDGSVVATIRIPDGVVMRGLNRPHQNRATFNRSVRANG